MSVSSISSGLNDPALITKEEPDDPDHFQGFFMRVGSVAKKCLANDPDLPPEGLPSAQVNFHLDAGDESGDEDGKVEGRIVPLTGPTETTPLLPLSDQTPDLPKEEVAYLVKAAAIVLAVGGVVYAIGCMRK